MKPSKIGFTDFSAGDLNFVTGCTPVSMGCRECYARRIYERAGRDFSNVVLHPTKLRRLERKRFPEYSPKRGAPHKPMCFVCDTGDLFHEKVPADFIIHAFEVMRYRADVKWLVFTKRMERANSVLFGEEGGFYLGGGDYYGNIRLIVSAENQEWADRRIRELLLYWLGPNGVSVEPMLAPVDLMTWFMPYHCPNCDAKLGQRICPLCGAEGYERTSLDWVICGAESGANRRPFDVAWAEDLYEQCKAAGIPYFFKQGSALRPGQNDELPNYGRIKQWPES